MRNLQRIIRISGMVGLPGHKVPSVFSVDIMCPPVHLSKISSTAELARVAVKDVHARKAHSS